MGLNVNTAFQCVFIISVLDIVVDFVVDVMLFSARQTNLEAIDTFHLAPTTA